MKVHLKEGDLIYATGAFLKKTEKDWNLVLIDNPAFYQGYEVKSDNQGYYIETVKGGSK